MRAAEAFALMVTIMGVLACNSEAKQHAQVLVDKKYKRCGDSTYSRYNKTALGTYKLKEYKDFAWKLEPKELTKADQLNGVEFRGIINYSYSAVRASYHYGPALRDLVFHPPDCWAKWETGGSFREILEIERISGAWKEAARARSILVGSEAPDCSEVINLPECTGE